VLWTNNCPRAAGFERWDALTPEQWERAYAAAEDLLQVVPDPAAASSTGRRVRDRLQSALTEQGRSIRGLPLAGHVVPDGGIRFNAPWDMLAAAAPAVRARIDVQPGVRVTRLDHRAGRVTAADVVGPGDWRDTIAAPVVLIAGGALATPRLLHRSAIRPDALGRGISFHALLFGQVVLEADLCPPATAADVAPRLWVPPTTACPWHLQVLRDTCPLPAAEAVANRHRLLEFQAFRSASATTTPS
jgi:hypothetical protein